MKANIKLGVILTDSFRSYGRHWKPLLAVGAATVMMNLLPLLSGTSDDIVFKQLIVLGMGFFLAPIFTFGLYRYLLKVWNGEQLGWKELLYYCGNLKRYGHTLLFQIYFGLLMLLMIVQGILGFLCIGIILLLFVGMEHIDFLMAFVENGYILTLFLFFAVGFIFTPLYWLMNAGFAYKVIQQTDWANQSEVFNHIVDEP